LSDQQELTAQQALRKQREREVYLLENDKEYIETIARDKLDMMKDGETIFRLDPSKGVPPAPKSP
jgi:cell division protein FtsB